MLLLPLVLAALAASAAADTWTLGSLEMTSCFGGGNFYCANISVPINHHSPVVATGDKVLVAFVVYRGAYAALADGTRRAWLFVQGGPGAPGHTSTSYARYMSAALGGAYDVVLFDPRGVGWSCGLGCAKAAMRHSWSAMHVDRLEFADRLESYRADCLDEIATEPTQAAQSDVCIVGSTETPMAQRLKLVPYIGSEQVARDLNVFFTAAGYSSIWVHGPSYGSMVSQIYCALFPKAVAGLILDSPINTTKSAWMTVDVMARENKVYLLRSFDLCWRVPECRRDFGGLSKHEAIRRILGSFTDLSGWPKKVSFRAMDWKHFNAANPATWTAELNFTLEREMVEYMFHAMSYESARTLRMRAYARLATKGDWTEVAKVAFHRFAYVLDLQTGDIRDMSYAADLMFGVLPIITGEDNFGRFYPHPRGPLTAGQRAKQLTAAINKEQYRFGFAGTVYAGDMGMSTAWEPENGPQWSVAVENATIAPSPGMHSYPIIVTSSATETVISPAMADDLYESYRHTGPAHRVIGEDGAHCPFASSTDGGPMYTCVAAAVTAIIANPSGKSSWTYCGNHNAALYKYWPHEDKMPDTVEDGVGRTLRALTMDGSYRDFYSPLIACATNGAAYMVTSSQSATSLPLMIFGCSFYQNENEVPASVVTATTAVMNLATGNRTVNGYDITFPAGLTYKALLTDTVNTCCQAGAKYDAATGKFTGTCATCA